MKKIPSRVAIDIADSRLDGNIHLGDVKRWVKKYNIRLVFASNTSIITSIRHSVGLRVAVFQMMRSFEKLDPLFKKGSNLHAVCVKFDHDVE